MSRLLPICLIATVATSFAADQRTALDRYVAKPDAAYQYRLVKTQRVDNATVFVLDMTSQRYLTKKEVNRPEWRHWVTIVKPARVKHSTGLLYIGGGGNDDKVPSAPTELVAIARATQSVVAEISMVPNQPLVFVGEKRTLSLIHI